MKTHYHKYQLQDSIVIGNSSHCDIEYNLSSIESYHAEIHIKKGKVISFFSPKLQVKKNDLNSQLSIFQLEELIVVVSSYFLMINSPEKVKVNLPQTIVETYPLRKDDSFWEVKKQVRFLTSYPLCKVKFKRIDPLQKEVKTSLLISIGPALLMTLASLISGSLSAYNSYMQGRSVQEVIPMLLLPLVMLISILIYQPLIKLYEKRKRTIQIKNRNDKIVETLVQLSYQLTDFQDQIHQCDKERFHSMQTLSTWIENKSSQLFFKTKDHDDFLKIALGYGEIESRIEFTNLPDEDDIFYFQKSNELIKKWKVFPTEWITLNLLEVKHFSIVGNYKNWLDYILLQFAVYYDRYQVELVFVITEEWLKKNSFLYAHPHTQSDSGNYFFSTNRFQFQRITAQSTNRIRIYIIENLKLIEGVDLKEECCIYLVNNEIEIPWYCKGYLIEMSGWTLVSEKEKKKITFVDKPTSLASSLYQLQHCRFLIDKNNIKKKSFLDLFDCNDSKDLTIKKRWRKNQYTLKVPIGFYENNDVFSIDLHEKAQGPHMMIGATTGAGKSEFILTFLLSLAVEFSYQKVQFVIIDFKGGGLSDSLKIDKKYIPHVAGVLTNLDYQEMERSLVSFKNECQRRQRLFSIMKEKHQLSTMNIDLYQKLWDLDPITAIAHLFIVVDEFAELKTTVPEFITEVVSLARIGRSLGIHLILSTQKPSSAVDGEIWSNTRCKICLKVQEKQDSIDMLQNDKAIYLKNPGEFYMKVDHHEEKGICAWANAPYQSNEESIVRVDEQGYSLKNSSMNEQPSKSEMMNILSEIITYSNPSEKQCLWLSPLEKITTPPLNNKLTLGKTDNYYEKKQSWLSHDFERNGHGVVYSLDSKEKNKLLKGLLYGFVSTRTSYRVIMIDLFYEWRKYIFPNNIQVLHKKDEIYLFFESLLEKFSEEREKTIIILTHYPKFSEDVDSFIYQFGKLLRDGPQYNVYFFIFTTTSSSIPYRWLSFFERKYCLTTKQKTEINAIFEAPLNIQEIKKDFGIVSGNPPLLFRIVNISDSDLIEKGVIIGER